MRDLHPSEAPPVAAEVEAAPIQLDMEDLEAILAHPRRNKAPGPSGWTYEHIQQLCHTPEGKTACLALLNALLAGSLPGYAELLDSDGLPLLKPNGGIRPIAIGETWLRLACLCAVHKLCDLGPSFAPLQNGVGVPGGAECIAHMVRTALDRDPEALLVSLDLQNAFNSVSWQAIFNAVAERAPSLMPFLKWVYGGASHIFVRGAPDDAEPMLCTSGVQQGDPLGPLLFALALQGPLEAVAQDHPAVRLVAYFDDINIVGPPQSACEAFEALSAQVRAIGLTPVPTKSSVYGHNTVVASVVGGLLVVA